MSYIVYRQNKRNRESEKKHHSSFYLIIPLKFTLTVNLSKSEFGCNWDKLLSFDSFLIDK